MTAKSIRYWGCEYSDANSVRFHLWASGQQHIALRLNDETLPMHPTGDGGFELTVNHVAPGSAYSFILPDGTAVPDPASRAQQGDVNGPS
ncbi:MAG: malto-oligosyltrehalose trehalohydrolase, partial [Leclercia adecarboxylata]|nr:malto-oligosyltrehalose trehalohydrolase [Leclercia adecarboxylata]